ncbi:MAG TPA: hypothetical protein VFS07_06375 [Gemmatimonadales bacterium]|jgi:hypothetical protein|nr:hypothetical protein [Gemmatimonadales bacterium]
MRLRHALIATLLGVVAAACSNQDNLLQPTSENFVDTVTLGALHGTSISLASGYSVAAAAPIRTDISSAFDFVYDLDSAGTPGFYPAAVLGVIPAAKTNPGLQRSDLPFDSITIAKSNGYITDSVLAVDTGDVFIARSRISCSIGVPLYAKLRILSVDTAAKSVVFEILNDGNCGYRGLEPGLPAH